MSFDTPTTSIQIYLDTEHGNTQNGAKNSWVSWNLTDVIHASHDEDIE